MLSLGYASTVSHADGEPAMRRDAMISREKLMNKKSGLHQLAVRPVSKESSLAAWLIRHAA